MKLRLTYGTLLLLLLGGAALGGHPYAADAAARERKRASGVEHKAEDAAEHKTADGAGRHKGDIALRLYTNADSLRVKWDAYGLRKRDKLRITADHTSTQSITVSADRTECLFTRVPCKQPVTVTVELLRRGRAKGMTRLTAILDGLDRDLARRIIADSASVTAGDGMYSVALPDGRSIFLMGDSYTGPVTDGRRSPSDRMYRNSYLIYDHGRVSAMVDGAGPDTSAAVPEGVTDEGRMWYWPGHGFARDGRLYVFQTLMYQGGEGMWGFRYARTDLLEYELPSLRLLRNRPIPFEGPDDVHYGMAVIDEGDYIYVYAQQDIRNDMNPVAVALVARTTPDELYSRWEYFTGEGWSAEAADAVPMQGLQDVAVSSQFNVFRLDGKYVLLTQEKRFNSGEIYTFVADTPWGPWRNRKLIFETIEHKVDELFTYNAMAHPQMERDGMIPVSYNVNTSRFERQFDDVSSYRPRFFWVEKDKILKP